MLLDLGYPPCLPICFRYQAALLVNAAHDQADPTSCGCNADNCTDQHRSSKDPPHQANTNRNRRKRGDD